VQDDRTDLKLRGQVDGGHCANALPVEDDVFGTDAVLCAQKVPGGLDVRVEVLFRRPTGRCAVAGIIVAEDVAVDVGP
jgi:hypothetical protein